ncbi:MAG: hypothetical protein A3G33_08540 [Omnitrophica bacterium RIFCSPLOWO2_12_FULL_44_17]|uniref:SGNH hydrolase-type esterase domain-containing protein n=1 Tax=Candidatus Danuiimicrobium aquiferis TaxID=1801832 RepID=A0A1G1KWB0_9BACT|nr:MAG: hypothetical protein A3B72_03760 [Omnitrophica bacterium RIFCSPHIGHO2_02_FULL_45_28]OGW90298.1 MAG: hypothetical protein A3E74_01255 [Omnitrophica bacterium RIFCSPHIGHO2_12_FULL_44_12]OGW97213.1 MAG: hypothetical protein A3G33_08540 [Omnitrophica bacterium RIFCSPLOWO2_12_FULL_44_17]OGX02269.1 MAG: hypothetical protein A3J12_08330 [Omnitrophica bacterium RIFCSPLOWO2_02_FULL_44_11]
MKVIGIICFGDSVLAGTGASTRDNCCSKIIKASVNIPVFLKGLNRDSSSGGLNRLESDVLQNPSCSHVLILFGNNDSWIRSNNQPETTIEQFEHNIKKIVEQITANNKIAILLNLQPLDGEKFIQNFPNHFNEQTAFYGDPVSWQKQYSDSIERMVHAYEWEFIDIRTPLEKDVTNVIGPDGLHPNDLGHKIIAETVLNYFKRYGLFI